MNAEAHAKNHALIALHIKTLEEDVRTIKENMREVSVGFSDHKTWMERAMQSLNEATSAEMEKIRTFFGEKMDNLNRIVGDKKEVEGRLLQSVIDFKSTLDYFQADRRGTIEQVTRALTTAESARKMSETNQKNILELGMHPTEVALESAKEKRSIKGNILTAAVASVVTFGVALAYFFLTGGHL